MTNSLIGEGTTLKGEFVLKGMLRIDGDFVGKIDEGVRVLVGKNGSAQAASTVPEEAPFITSDIIIIGGKARGNLHARERIVILEDAEVFGDIVTPRMVIEEGAVFEGQCTVIKSENPNTDKISDKKAISIARKTLEETAEVIQ